MPPRRKKPNVFTEFLDDNEPTTQPSSTSLLMPGADQAPAKTSRQPRPPTDGDGDVDEAGEPTGESFDFSERVLVPNAFSRITPGLSRIAIIGEAPGEAESYYKTPFCTERTPTNPYSGASGRFLNMWLSKAGIVRDQCFVGNVCQTRPPRNKIENFSWNGPEIQTGLSQLAEDLKVFNPNICILLGRSALYAAKGTSNMDWRGSVFISDVPGPFFERKCISSYHPAACLRTYEWTPLLFFDLRKAKRHSESKDWSPPYRDLAINLTYEELIYRLDVVLQAATEVSLDIEGYVFALECISIATSPEHSFLVPFTKLDGSSYWGTTEEETRIWWFLSRILAERRIKKTWQNGLYDRFVLQYGYNCMTYGNQEDTMLKVWEQWCELEKGLAFQCSVLGDEPYYKSDRKSDSYDVKAKYCCKDSAVTLENSKKLDKLLTESAQKHYRFNHDLLNPILYMECRGIRYELDLARKRLLTVNDHINVLQTELDHLSGFGIPPSSTKDEIAAIVQEVMCYKRDKFQPKKPFTAKYGTCKLLLNSDSLTSGQITAISILCKRSLNLKSPDFKTYLYETLKLTPQYKKNPDTGQSELTIDYEALLKLSKLYPGNRVIEVALQLGMLRTRAQMLEIGADPDGRIRCGYNIVGTETGRLTCYTSPTGSGYNLQTIPAENILHGPDDPLRAGMRDLFVADIGRYIFQCDLSGADGWTVAAHLTTLGDPTMFEDYRFGIKPAKVLCYLLRHGADSLAGKSRAEILEMTKEIEKESWDYFACKIGQHGTSYLMGPDVMAKQVLIQSEGKMSLTRKEAQDVQRLFTIRYRVQLWHEATRRKLAKSPEMVSACGHRRRFFGRPRDILGQALAHEPQNNTTYATNLAAHNLWHDPDNRVGKELRIEPLHQVHDALLGQFKIEDTAWAVGKIKSYFLNPIYIAGIKVTIPFEGNYGTNWALDKASKVGDIR